MSRIGNNPVAIIAFALAVGGGSMGGWLLAGNGAGGRAKGNQPKVLRSRLTDNHEKMQGERRVMKIGLDGHMRSLSERGSSELRGETEEDATVLQSEEIAKVIDEIVELALLDDSVPLRKIAKELKRAHEKRDVVMMKKLLHTFALRSGRSALSRAAAGLGEMLGAGLDPAALTALGGGDAPDQSQNGVIGTAADGRDEDIEFVEDFGAEDKTQAALDAWRQKILECNTEAERIAMIKDGMLSLDDVRSCNSLSMKLITSVDKVAAVNAAVEIIATGKESSLNPAKTAYKWITGQEWTGADAAKAWAANYSD